jgi:hypothetical protein
VVVKQRSTEDSARSQSIVAPVAIERSAASRGRLEIAASRVAAPRSALDRCVRLCKLTL